MPDNLYPHIILSDVTSTERFRSPRGGGSRAVPARNRTSHGGALRRQLQDLPQRVTTEPEMEIESGLQIEFVGFDDVRLAFESLPRERSGIELLNVRSEGERLFATVFVPEGKLSHFERIIEDYVRERRGARNQALDHRLLIDTIQEIRAATLRALWTDDPDVFPSVLTQPIWWEVWLPVRNDRARILQGFRTLADRMGIRQKRGELVFPERTVVLAYASAEHFQRSATLLSLIAELRRAKETAEFFDALSVPEQAEWVDDLVARARYAPPDADVPYVCLLDTGVNRGHPLLDPALHGSDMHTVEQGWGVDDSAGHGTLLAGLALFGDLTTVLDSGEIVAVEHRLESVKILQDDGGNVGDPEFHGHLTTEAVARPEIRSPDRRRVFSLAISSRDSRDRGRPSAWSAAIDRLASDADGDGTIPRLIVVSGGNVHDLQAWANYPDSNTSDSIHDPGQAWNALSVGAATDLVNITEAEAEGYHPVARAGALSPFSTTSMTWQPMWPLKPDVLFEGGNVAKDAVSAIQMASLSLLTTHHIPPRMFTTATATSAAAAQAARLGARLMVSYPELWPEAVRGLIVHSASWTDQMRRTYLPPVPSKADYEVLARHCGFGVPSEMRALWSASNSLSMIVQEELRPFDRDGSKDPTLRDMNLHDLPWPLAELEMLGGAIVEMRVTLSYFIEPNPSARGRSRYRYESHGLRFDVKRSHETVEDFRRRVNRAARDEEEGTLSRGDDTNWLIGSNNRHKGSLHSDIWRGTAAELASRGVIAVYPALGWWKTRAALERWNKTARYALLVSIHAPEVEIDLYTAVMSQIETPIRINV